MDNVSLVGGTPFGALVAAIASVIISKDKVLPAESIWNGEVWKFWLAVISLGIMAAIIFVTMVSVFQM